MSGAGRSPKLATLYCETNESIAAYSVGVHRHQPEIDDLVQRISGRPVATLFTPHLTPMDRGILSTIYVRSDQKAQRLMECWRERYANSPFVHAVDHLPATKHVSGTNFVQMTARDAGGRIVIVCAIDNLAKGASGAADPEHERDVFAAGRCGFALSPAWRVAVSPQPSGSAFPSAFSRDDRRPEDENCVHC